MSITQKEVEHAADLARIALTQEEKTKFEKDLSSILSFVEQLSTADTSKVKPMTGGTTLTHVVRSDSHEDASLENKNEALIRAVPNGKVKNGWVRVEKIL